MLDGWLGPGGLVDQVAHSHPGGDQQPLRAGKEPEDVHVGEGRPGGLGEGFGDEAGADAQPQQQPPGDVAPDVDPVQRQDGCPDPAGQLGEPLEQGGEPLHTGQQEMGDAGVHPQQVAEG
jgi:hypothetical protein